MNNEKKLVIIVGVAFVGLYFLLQATNAFDLSLITGVQMLGRLLAIIIGYFILTKGLGYFTFSDLLPLFFALLTTCLWPALDEWSSNSPYTPFSTLDIDVPGWEPMWYATWTFKIGLPIAILSIGYGVKKVWNER